MLHYQHYPQDNQHSHHSQDYSAGQRVLLVLESLPQLLLPFLHVGDGLVKVHVDSVQKGALDQHEVIQLFVYL